MKTLLIYKSRTDFTKRYAEWIAEEAECVLMEFGDITGDELSDYDRIVYGSRIHAGVIDSFKKIKEMFRKSEAKELIVFATGGTPNAASQIIDGIWEKNLSAEELVSIPHFYMQSGICYEKMSLSDKAIMKMAATMMSKKKEKDSYETGFEQAIGSSYDISAKEYADPLINYLKETKSVQEG